MAKEGLIKAQKAMLSGKYDIIVFDEITTAHYFHLISIQEMLVPMLAMRVKAKEEGLIREVCAGAGQTNRPAHSLRRSAMRAA